MSFFICNFGAATCPTEDIAAVLNYAAIIKMWWSGKGGGEKWVVASFMAHFYQQ